MDGLRIVRTSNLCDPEDATRRVTDRAVIGKFREG